MACCFSDAAHQDRIVLNTYFVFSTSLLLTAERADNRGRVTLGSELANKEVQLAVLEVDGDD